MGNRRKIVTQRFSYPDRGPVSESNLRHILLTDSYTQLGQYHICIKDQIPFADRIMQDLDFKILKLLREIVWSVEILQQPDLTRVKVRYLYLACYLSTL